MVRLSSCGTNFKFLMANRFHDNNMFKDLLPVLERKNFVFIITLTRNLHKTLQWTEIAFRK